MYGKVHPTKAMKAQRGNRGTVLLLLQPQSQREVSGKCHAPGTLPLGKRLGIHCTGD